VDVKVGTFNLNNLFSRFNFRAHVDEVPEEERDVTVSFEFTEEGDYWFRTFRGRLIQPMPTEQAQTLAARIQAMDLDVLAVQEVEDIEALRDFNREFLSGLYANAVLVEGNDPRFIDVGVLSKTDFPIGAVTSWQHRVHPQDPSRPVFSRDLLEVEILDRRRTRRLFTLYNNHLKSQFVMPGEDPAVATPAANLQRTRQAEMVARIVEERMRPDSRFLVVGDMNDTPESPPLQAFSTQALRLVNGLADPEETRPAKADQPPPASKAWTHRFKEGGAPARYELFDQVWLSPSLAGRQTGAFIDRRIRHGGDGSDHDPAWVVLNL
jgi:endonuclease/exonuclease/phosphatase family metal-dependent hydrolase